MGLYLRWSRIQDHCRFLFQSVLSGLHISFLSLSLMLIVHLCCSVVISVGFGSGVCPGLLDIVLLDIVEADLLYYRNKLNFIIVFTHDLPDIDSSKEK